jgi:hypothetical protein
VHVDDEFDRTRTLPQAILPRMARGCPVQMTIGTRPPCERLSVGGDPVSLDQGDLDRLLAALGGLGLQPAATVRDDIAALRLAGGVIDLLPTEAELSAVWLALAAAAELAPLGPALLQLQTLCDLGFERR